MFVTPPKSKVSDASKFNYVLQDKYCSLIDLTRIYIGRPQTFYFLNFDHSSGGKRSGYGAQVKSPGQILILFSLVLKVAENDIFCFLKGPKNPTRNLNQIGGTFFIMPNPLKCED
jgi:hypothetical protein